MDVPLNCSVLTLFRVFVAVLVKNGFVVLSLNLVILSGLQWHKHYFEILYTEIFTHIFAYILDGCHFEVQCNKFLSERFDLV